MQNSDLGKTPTVVILVPILFQLKNADPFEAHLKIGCALQPGGSVIRLQWSLSLMNIKCPPKQQKSASGVRCMDCSYVNRRQFLHVTPGARSTLALTKSVSCKIIPGSRLWQQVVN